MKYTLELLDSTKLPKIYDSRDLAITALNNYNHHRPGQPIVVVYNDGNTKNALIAVGTGSGNGVEGNKKNYVIIGCDCTGSSSSSPTVSSLNASNVFVNKINYKNLLDDMYDLYGVRRFGYLGTNNDPWRSLEYIPAGESVQRVLSAILEGNRTPQPVPAFRSLSMTVAPVEVYVPDTGANFYVVTVTADFDGEEIDSATLSVTGGTSYSEFEGMLERTHQFQAIVPVSSDYPLAIGQEETITYTAAVTVGGVEKTAAASVKIIKPEPGPTPTYNRYTVTFKPNGQSGNSDVTRTYQTPAACLGTTADSLGWQAQQYYVLAGWSKTPDGSVLNTLAASDYTQDPADPYLYTLDLYAQWEERIPEPSRLVVFASATIYTYDGTQHTYDISNIIVKDSGDNLVDPQYYRLEWVGNYVPTKTSAGDETGYITAVSLDSALYTDSEQTEAKLTIGKRPASVTVQLRAAQNDSWSTSLSLELGSTAPLENTVIAGFLTEDEQYINLTGDYREWSPALDMNRAGDYDLDFTQDLAADLPTYSNYSVTKTAGRLTVTPPSDEVTFTTTGYTDEPAVTYDELGNSGFFQSAAASQSSVGLTDPAEWLFFESNRSSSLHTTTLKIYGQYTSSDVEFKIWSSTNRMWQNMSANIMSQFTFTTGEPFTHADFEKYDEAQGDWKYDKYLIAIKINR